MNSMFNNLEDNFNTENLEFNSKNQHIYCLAHIINLAVQEILKILYNNNNESNDSEDSDDEITTTNTLGALGKV
jgi:hypothetical protein